MPPKAATNGVVVMPGIEAGEAELLARLNRRFRAADVEIRERKFHYVSIDSTINRFNEVLGFNWSLQIQSLSPVAATGAETTTGKPIFRVTAYGFIQVNIGGKIITRAGAGSSESFDTDMAVKTVQAEVMKKAGHQFGVGLYLWDERERNLVDLVHRGDIRGAVKLLCQIENVSDPEDIGSRFDVLGCDLKDENVQRAILANGGLF